MPERIGVYLCECGPNIAEAVDLGRVAVFARGLPNVVRVAPFGLLCAQTGKDFLKHEIREHRLTRVVIAACSPKENEHTFRQVLIDSGVNPFLMQMANIREQCSWVIKDKRAATEQAKQLIHAAASRVIHNQPLETREIECSPDVLVLGAGIAGISAALTLAQKNRKVYLVETSPCIGGKAARHEDLFPSLECASCVLSPKFDELLHNDQIELLTLTDVKEVLGYFGNFTVTVNRKPRFVDAASCIGCNLCIDVCPVKTRNEYNERLDERHAVYIPYPGALPNLAVIDSQHCLRFNGTECTACRDACPFNCIHYDDEDRIQELRVGAIVLATGFDLFDLKKAPRYGYGKAKNIYTSLEFERLLNSSGPTEGKILLKSGRFPDTIAFVHCAGSRTKKFHEHCSAICCTYLLKFIHQVRKKLPGTQIAVFHSDFCLPGMEAQILYNRLHSDEHVRFLRLKEPDTITIDETEDILSICCLDPGGAQHVLTCDMAVLAPAMEAAQGADHTAKICDMLQDKAGFFSKAHVMTAPSSTTREGIYAAGCAQGPTDVMHSVAQGESAAGKIISGLVPGKRLVLEAATAHVDKEACSGCTICISGCIYKAITYDPAEKCVSVNDVICKGCGACAATCPSGAISARHFSDGALSAEIAAFTSRPTEGRGDSEAL
ncbi:MAG: hypothetical protein A2V65_07055 [Deltaproteobacteria bacterium RBG_13_49_15]|nr:MAG: hypothetical protein A2V65_07055 [Deltaproteobacteria bacterium RBG_13_49_15]